MSKLKLNRVLSSIPPSGIRKFFEIVAEMPDVISLSVGEPDFATPWHVRESAIHALESGDTHYTGNRGTPELRQEIARYFGDRFGVDYDPATEMLVTNGASEAFDLAVRACLNHGDEVLIPSPGYVMYAPLITLAGGVPVMVSSTPKSGFQISVKQLSAQITPRTKALVLNYPNNPTGATLSKSELKELAKLAAKHNLIVFSDEIYAELTYPPSSRPKSSSKASADSALLRPSDHTAFASLPQMKERTVTISGFSKAWAMTGARLGYLAAPAAITALATKIHQYSALCANSISQAAALEALRHGESEVAKMRDEYQVRRDFCVREFNRLGLQTANPAGAFYLFPNVRRKTGLTGDEFALRLLKQKNVAVVPGSAFGTEFSDFVRVSYATGLAELNIAIERIEEFVS